MEDVNKYAEGGDGVNGINGDDVRVSRASLFESTASYNYRSVSTVEQNHNKQTQVNNMEVWTKICPGV